MTQTTRPVSHRDGIPIYRYRTDPDIPPVSVHRHDHRGTPDLGRHIHDFPALWYVPDDGLVYVAAPGEVLEPPRPDSGVAVFFDPTALGEDARSPWPAWRAHPLLFPFLHGRAGGVLGLEVPGDRQPLWDNTIRSIESELAAQQEGYRQAALAHLTVLLIELARLARNSTDLAADLRRSGEPLLADVFTVIDERHGEPLSLRDVAREVGMTPGHLTTVVRRRTGRTVQEWIIERRMTEARSLLADTDLPVAEVARKVGVADPGYFSRLFSRTHGASPRQWRASPARRGIR
jgi:AraC family transcriptional regulator, transcriptional activator of pobA